MDEAVQVAFLEILKNAILGIRLCAWSEDSARCAIEADHVHNIPELLKGPLRRELVEFYWEIERRAYVSQLNGNAVPQFTHSWATIERYLHHSSANLSADEP